MPGLRKRIVYEGPKNLRAPVELDVTQTPWDVRRMDGVFSANTMHIMSWSQVEALFTNLPAILKPGAVLAIYGPFNYRGDYTSPSNRAFDQMLRARDPASGIRDVEAVHALAAAAGLQSVADHAMPANNRLLVWSRRAWPSVIARAGPTQ